MYVISLTAIPPRFDHLGPMLEAMLVQEVRPEAVVLYIPKRYRRFPDYTGALPVLPKGVEIRVVDEDLGPATKVLFAADELRGQDVDILFCDDDRIYLPDWSTRFMEAHAAHPGCAIVSAGFDLSVIGIETARPAPWPRGKALQKKWDTKYHWQRFKQNLASGGRQNVGMAKRAPRNFFRRSGYVDVGEGFGGFLVRPEHLTRDAWTIPPVMWAVDDVWISGQLAIHGVPIWAQAGASRFHTSEIQKVAALHAAIIDGANRAEANRACALYMQENFGIWGGKVAAPDA